MGCAVVGGRGAAPDPPPRPEALLAGPRNTIVFERDPAIKDAVFKLFSTNHSPETQANCLAALLCCLPTVAAPDLGYETSSAS